MHTELLQLFAFWKHKCLWSYSCQHGCMVSLTVKEDLCETQRSPLNLFNYRQTAESSTFITPLQGQSPHASYRLFKGGRLCVCLHLVFWNGGVVVVLPLLQIVERSRSSYFPNRARDQHRSWPTISEWVAMNLSASGTFLGPPVI